jgi:hypothetical protein
MKNDLSATLCNAIEKEWLEHWKEQLSNPNITPHQVMQTYVEAHDITIAGLDEEMDWSCWESNINKESK